MRLYAAALTDIGRVRVENQDSFFCKPDFPVYGVFDGLGGHNGGAEASRIARETLLKMLQQHCAEHSEQNLRKVLETYSRLANHGIFSTSQAQPYLRGMGTTAALFGFEENRKQSGLTAHICLVGDSRVYLLRKGHLFQLGMDQSWYNMQVKNGLYPTEAEREFHRNVIAHCLGVTSDNFPSFYSLACQPADLIFAASDGLFSMLTHEEIRQCLLATLQTETDPTLVLKTLCTNFITRANETGGKDNTTVVCAIIEELPTKTEDKESQVLLGFHDGSIAPPCKWADALATMLKQNEIIFLASDLGESYYVSDKLPIKSWLKTLQNPWTAEHERALRNQIEWKSLPITTPKSTQKREKRTLLERLLSPILDSFLLRAILLLIVATLVGMIIGFS